MDAIRIEELQKSCFVIVFFNYHYALDLKFKVVLHNIIIVFEFMENSLFI